MLQPKTVTTKELRDNLSEIIEKVAGGGHSFIVSKFGKKKVLVSPYKEDKKKKVDLSKLPAFGMWKDREDMKDSVAWERQMRLKQSLRIHDK
jgi:antitoxin (DNA-binding transcriptional repressor) of toxin-antitoxin stability system